jgi:HK97 gp10 family phage protein
MARANVKVTITGADGLKARLVDILPEQAKKTIIRVFNQGGDRIANGARALVPRDTGELAQTITNGGTKVNKRGGLSNTIYAGNPATREGQGNSFQRARLVEFGTREVAAQPFLMPVFRREKRNIDAAVRRALRTVVKEAGN